MAEEKEERIFVNTPMEPDLVEKLDQMVEETESTRAQFIRLLVKRQWNEFEHLGKVKAKVFKGRKPTN